MLVEAPVEAGGDGVGQRVADGGSRRLEAEAQAEAEAEAENGDGREASESGATNKVHDFAYAWEM